MGKKSKSAECRTPSWEQHEVGSPDDYEHFREGVE
jgi:hypothetical protein